MEVRGQLHAQGKSTWYTLDRRLDGPHSRSGRGDGEKNSLSLPGLEPPIIQSITQHYTTELSRLNYLQSKVTDFNARKIYIHYGLVYDV
jgi:hypothetical protein